MLFDTPVYLVFLFLIVVVYLRLNLRRQNATLLFASYLFYGWWDWRFLLLMIASTAVDFVIACRIEDRQNSAWRRRLLIASLVLNFSILGFFNYFTFFLIHGTRLKCNGVLQPSTKLSRDHPASRHFFLYVSGSGIHCRRLCGKNQGGADFVDYGLFISLFPHLIAGPIQRPSHLLPQVQRPRAFCPTAFRDGCMLILMGFVRKAVIADNAAHLANAAFSGGLGNNGWATLIGCYALPGRFTAISADIATSPGAAPNC